MDKSELAQKAYDFVTQFKAEVLRQMNQINAAFNDGTLQDGYCPIYLDDGWVSLKGFSWGFIVQYDDPVRMDMTFGPDGPFVGHRLTFLAQPVGNGLAWVNQDSPREIYFGMEQLARYGLRKLACKCGDEDVFLQISVDQPAAGVQNEMDYDNYAGYLDKQ